MRTLLALAALVIACGGCGPSGPLKFAGLQLGRTLNSDESVGGHTTQFRPSDTIYASVLTEGAGAGTITARWLYAGRLVSEASRDVSYNRGEYTSFHIQNSGGFPPGDYRVEIHIDGTEVARRDFRVQK